MPSDPIPDSDLAEMERRCEAATPGTRQVSEHGSGEYRVFRDDEGALDLIARFAEKDDALLFAHAHQDMPRLLAEVRTLRAEVDELGCTLGDEEASHGETLRLWNIAKEQVETLTQQRDEAQATVESIATMLGWINVPPRESLERNLSALRQRLENAEAEVERLRQRVAELEGGAK